MPRFNLSWLYVIIAMSFAILYFSNQEGGIDKQITYTEFKDMINKGYANKIIAYDDNTVEMYIKPEFVKDVFKNDYKKVGRNPALNVEIGSMESLDKFMEKAQEEGHFTGSISYEKKRDYFGALFWNIAPFLLLIGIWMFAMRRMSGGAGAGGANPFNVGKSKAQVYEKGDKTNRITFKDVAGQAEAKQEVEEIVEFLKQPQKYTELGGKIPKGALLVGPPGTGKTLLAKAVAGEADVPFFSLSGSDFVEMFVGVGASRVRDLFRQAKEKAPCIIFIDEIDAVGRARGKNPSMGGNDERENTLNQLLTEMDGFGSNSGVIILAATNRADILDKALLRAGRFDRQITVNRPDAQGREDILKVHSRNKPLGPDVDLKEVAKDTIGFTGADLENLLNEAALLAVRRKKKALTMAEINDASSRVQMGTEKKSHKYSEKAKRLTAYHEAGHAVAAYYVEGHDPVKEISIIPRGLGAGGYTWYTPQEENYNSKKEMLDDLISMLGGRVAEALALGDISTGASSDLERATAIAHAMVAKYGMSEVLGPAVFSDENDEVFLGKDFGHVNNYSEATSAKIDAEIERMMRHAYSQTEEILKTHYEKLELVAETLLQKEKVTGEMFAQLMENGKLDEPEAQPTEEPEAPAAETQTAADTAPVPAPEDGDAPAAEAANAPADPAPEAPKSDR